MESSYYHKTIRKKEDVGRQGSIDSLKFTPDGKYIVCASKKKIEVWNIESGSQIRIMGATKHPLSWIWVEISPDGRYIIAGIDYYKVKVWEFSSGRLLWKETTRGHVLNIDISNNGKNIVGVTGRYRIHTWDLRTGKRIDSFKTRGLGYRLVFSPDDNYIVYSSKTKKAIYIWDISNRTIIRELKTKKMGHIDSLVISPNMKYVISGSSNKLIHIWDFSTGEKITTLDDHSDRVRSRAITPNGKYLVSGSWDKTIKIWDLPSGQLIRTLTGHKGWIDAVAVSPDGTRIASGSTDQNIKIWDLN